MKHLVIAMSMALAACTPTQLNNSPKASIVAANNLYYIASQSGEELVKAGVLDVTKYKKADADAYAVLHRYRTGGATLDELVKAVNTITKK
jgi:hypothetical protein